MVRITNWKSGALFAFRLEAAQRDLLIARRHLGGATIYLPGDDEPLGSVDLLHTGLNFCSCVKKEHWVRSLEIS